ncbi:MAG: hypothetical protein HKN44_03850, partial [Ilumatobacter sp.]|nr:hypothetical protein [Ilumatobacter sp.]
VSRRGPDRPSDATPAGPTTLPVAPPGTGAGATQGGTGLPDRNIERDTDSESADGGTIESTDGGAAPPFDARQDESDALALALVISSSGAPLTSVIEIAPELADLAPTEVVALDFENSVVEVSIPSGRVRVTDIGFPTSGTRLVTTDFGALVWPMPGGAYELLSANSERAFVEGAPPVAVAATPGLDRFYVWHSDGDDTPVWVTANGDQVAGRPAPANLSDILVDPLGILLDAGGASGLPDRPGASLASTAVVVSTGRNHVLLRECDEGGHCALSTLDRNGFRTLFASDLPDDANPLRIDGLSPSGDALLMAAVRKGSVDNPPALEVLELVDGSRRVLRARPDAPARAAWASDSSGVFFADVQLYFIDRLTAAAVVVSPELPKLRLPTARRPRRSAACELLGVVMPVFDDMRAAEGAAPVPPPQIDVLLRVIAAQPGDIVRQTRPLVNFVASFVSIEQPESQRPENWPADVRAGLDALDEAAAAC